MFHRNSILSPGVVGASIGYDHEADERRGCAIWDSDIVIVPKGTEIGPA